MWHDIDPEGRRCKVCLLEAKYIAEKRPIAAGCEAVVSFPLFFKGSKWGDMTDGTPRCENCGAPGMQYDHHQIWGMPGLLGYSCAHKTPPKSPGPPARRKGVLTKLREREAEVKKLKRQLRRAHEDLIAEKSYCDKYRAEYLKTFEPWKNVPIKKLEERRR